MAIWQLDIYIVDLIVASIDTNRKSWGEPVLPLSLVHDFQEELVHYLGNPWLMARNWLVFGPKNGNGIDIVFGNDVHASVSVRCDLREEAPQFLVLVCDLARFHGCRFFNSIDGEFIEPDLELLLEAIRKSQIKVPCSSKVL